ncbi:hypothetical protein WJX82_002042 [Trebouxia sp. C0006]
MLATVTSACCSLGMSAGYYLTTLAHQTVQAVLFPFRDDLLCLVHHPPAFQLLGRHLYQTVIMCRNHPARRLHPTQEGITAAAFSLDTIPLQGCLRLAMVWHQATLKLTSGL